MSHRRVFIRVCLLLVIVYRYFIPLFYYTVILHTLNIGNVPLIILHNFINLGNISNIYRVLVCMEEHTCAARLPHINGGVVRKWEISYAQGCDVS